MTQRAFIESYRNVSLFGTKERKVIKGFACSDDMHKFLNKGANALAWREYSGDLKPGTYAFASGVWHNVKKLDSFVLAHI